jgi:HAD superfamily hydrolase (TIGR01509 family)
MAKPRIVLFDIGGTLWSSPAEDPAALAGCYGLGRDILCRAVSEPPAIEALIDAVEGYFAEWEERWRADATIVEQRRTPAFVAEALQRTGLAVDAGVLEAFTDAILEVSVGTARVEPPEPGMREALEGLRALGLRLGCVSNAFMGAATLQRIMDERGLGPYLEFTVSSCELGYRKPHPEIYRAALRHFDVAAPEAVFVGDRLDADVAGPASLGMRTVLTHQYRREDQSDAKVAPDAVIGHLSELVPYVRGLLA